MLYPMLRHSRTGMAEQMAQALYRGAESAAVEMESREDLVIDIMRAKEVQVGMGWFFGWVGWVAQQLPGVAFFFWFTVNGRCWVWHPQSLQGQGFPWCIPWSERCA